MALGLFSKPGKRASGTPFLFTATGVEPVVSTDKHLIALAAAGPAEFNQFLIVISRPSI